MKGIKIKVKPRTYYKLLYSNEGYDIVYTGNKWVYIIADKDKNKLLEKRNKKFKYKTIKEFQDFIKNHDCNIEEISKEDVFLELL